MIPIEQVRKPWAILPETLSLIAQMTSARALAYRDRLAAGAMPRADRGSVAIIPVRGIISHRPGLFTQFFGGSSVLGLTQMLRSAVSDPGISTIIFDVDSPGGQVDGVPELTAEIRTARAKKRIIAIANCTAASAGYWIASAAGEVAITPSGQLGAIGIFAVHEDISRMMDAEGVKISLVSAGRYKVDGNPYEPLSSSARSDLQAKVDAVHSMFVNSVARGRGVKPESVRTGFGEGRLVLARDAVRLGMADKIATLDEIVAGVFTSRQSGAGAYGRSVAMLRRELQICVAGRGAAPAYRPSIRMRRRQLELCAARMTL